MRQLQKGNQAAQRSDCRRNWLSRVLILRTLWKTDHRVPEEAQASSAQDDRMAPHRIPHATMDRDRRVFFLLAFFPRPSPSLALYFFGPTRSLIGGTLAVSQVKARQPSCQPSSIVASMDWWL